MVLQIFLTWQVPCYRIIDASEVDKHELAKLHVMLFGGVHTFGQVICGLEWYS